MPPWERLGGLLGHLGAVSGASWGIVVAPWGLLAHLGGVFGASWAPLGASRGRPERLLGRVGNVLGTSWVPLGDFVGQGRPKSENVDFSCVL